MPITICFFIFSLRGKIDQWGSVLLHHFIFGPVKIIILKILVVHCFPLKTVIRVWTSKITSQSTTTNPQTPKNHINVVSRLSTVLSGPSYPTFTSIHTHVYLHVRMTLFNHTFAPMTTSHLSLKAIKAGKHCIFSFICMIYRLSLLGTVCYDYCESIKVTYMVVSLET
ncbi:hypothetical protein E2C01_025512 [Portunus trituberculatus]|uniref:Uncharacterized protein n=1 Tax=Portunus trituberculatus TaxID=210409 RepID=A0A5B7EG46_PORTR|nr:hypothetical protein [Portunus trituberculatus]